MVRFAKLSAIRFFKIRACTLFCLGFVYCAANKSQLGAISEEGRTMMQFLPTEIWKRHAVILTFTVEATSRRFHSIWISI